MALAAKNISSNLSQLENNILSEYISIFRLFSSVTIEINIFSCGSFYLKSKFTSATQLDTK